MALSAPAYDDLVLPTALPIAKLNLRRPDVLAGLSVIGLMVPEAVAYSQLAGMPARAGLVALFCGLVVYGLLGKSRFAVASSTSSTALILASVLGTFGTLTMPEKSALTFMLVVMAGGWFLLMAAFRLGVIANFIAKPVLRGVSLGLAVLITLSQFPTLVGVNPGSGKVWHKVGVTLAQIQHWNIPSVLLGVAALIILFGWRSRVQPVTLWVLLLSILAVRSLNLSAHGVELVGEIPLLGIAPDWTVLGRTDWTNLAQFAFALAMMAYAESASTIRSFALKHGDQTSENRDLAALGAANVLSGTLGGLAVGAGFSGTSANERSGAQSKGAGWVAATSLVLVVAFLLPQIAYVPQPVLAAIVISAVSHGLNWQPLRPYFQWARDRLLVIVAVAAVILLGVLNGLLVAVSLSVLLTLLRFSRPRLSILGRWQGGHDFVNITRYPEAVPPKDLLVIRIDEPLFFANVDPIMERIRSLVHRHEYQPYRAVILSMEESPDLDGTAVEALGNFARELQLHHKQLKLCRLHSAAQEVMVRAQFPALPAHHLSSLSVDGAVREFEDNWTSTVAGVREMFSLPN